MNIIKAKPIDPVDIRRAVRKGELNFYADELFIYCRELPINGETFIVGNSRDREE